MYTQQAPSLVRVLREALPPGQVDQLTNSLANCQQPLAHRGPVHLAPPASLGRNRRGVYGPGAWDPARHPGLVPTAGNPGLYDIGGMQPPVWNSGNRYASGFNFPTEQFFTLNNYLGGPQVYINNSDIDNITNQTFQGNTVSANHVNTFVFNGQRLPGIAGPAGAPGQVGAPGAAGADGFDGLIPVGAFRPLNYLAGNRPRAQVRPRQIPPRVTDVWVIPAGAATIPTEMSFDPVMCAVTVSATTTVMVSAASTAASTRLSNLQRAGQPLAPVTIAGVAFGNPLPITAKILNIRPEQARVLQQ